MKKVKLPGFRLIGLSLKSKTINENGQSNRDCGNLWQKFEEEEIANKINNKLSEDIFAVYHNYEGDHTKPFSYFIGCKVASDAKVPRNLKSLVIQEGTYTKKIAQGKMPGCITDAWEEVWNADLSRAYKADFEVYDERSKNWDDAEVDIYVSNK